MDRANRKKRRKQFAAEERVVRDIIIEWESVDFGVPEDEYDYLVHRALSVLHGDGTKDELAAETGPGLEDHFALGPFPETEVNPVVDRIWEWWQQRSS